MEIVRCRIHSYVNVTLIKFENEGGTHVQQLETTRLFGEIFFLSKRWSLLERRKNGVEPSRTTENLKKNVQFTRQMH